MIGLPPQPFGDNWRVWAQRLLPYLVEMKNRLTWKRGDEVATDDGILLWDSAINAPVVTLNGEFRELVIKDGHGIASSSTDISPLAINTAYPIVWDAIALNDQVSLGTPASRIVFTRGGTFLLSFTVQVTSNSASTKTLWFWPRIDGVDVPNSTMKVSIHNSTETTVLSRTVLFDIAAGSYLEAVYEADDVNVTLESAPAGVNAPATPSALLSVVRMHQ